MTLTTMPVQPVGCRLPADVVQRAFEVYVELNGRSQTLERINQRGGLSVPEIIAFLYAYPFPRGEWRDRVDEACCGMDVRIKRW